MSNPDIAQLMAYVAQEFKPKNSERALPAHASRPLAGAGQVSKGDGRAISRAATSPAGDSVTQIRGGYGRSVVNQRDQGEDFSVNG